MGVASACVQGRLLCNVLLSDLGSWDTLVITW